MSASPIKPSSGKWSDGVKILVSAVYILTPLGLMVYRLAHNQSPDSLILFLVIVIVFISMYTLFGAAKVDKAVETAKEVAGDKESDGEKEED